MQERTKKQPRARPERKATLPVNIKKSRHLPNDQLFVPRDHIVPFRTGVFGLTQTGAVDSDVRVFDEHRNPVYDDRAVILWHDKARRPTFGYFLQQERKVYKDTKRDRRRIAMATEGHLRATATTQMLKGGPGTFQWFDLEPGDVFAVEVGTFLPCRTGGYRSRATAWPPEYLQLPARPDPETKDEWERRQRFMISVPAGCPWPDWDSLMVDPTAAIGPKDWVAALEATPQGTKTHLGQVENLTQRFTITDVGTGKRITLGAERDLYFGTVVGMSRDVRDGRLARRKRKPDRSVKPRRQPSRRALSG